MNARFVSFVLLAFIPISAAPQWKEGGTNVPDEPWRRSSGKFGAMLVVTDRADEFLEAWSKPAAPGYVPSIKPSRTAKRQDVVDAILLFSQCEPDDQGSCNCEADFTVLKPDGSIYATHPHAKVWKSQPPPGTNLQVADARLRFRIEDTDQLGTYRIQAVVRDLVAKSQVSLEWQIAVEPS
jgi:hypothetical protein